MSVNGAKARMVIDAARLVLEKQLRARFADDPRVEDAVEDIVAALTAEHMLKMPRVHGTPSHCAECRRPLRAKSAPKTPGTFPHGGGGFCTACYYRKGTMPRRIEFAAVQDTFERADQPIGAEWVSSNNAPTITANPRKNPRDRDEARPTP